MVRVKFREYVWASAVQHRRLMGSTPVRTMCGLFELLQRPRPLQRFLRRSCRAFGIPTMRNCVAFRHRASYWHWSQTASDIRQCWANLRMGGACQMRLRCGFSKTAGTPRSRQICKILAHKYMVLFPTLTRCWSAAVRLGRPMMCSFDRSGGGGPGRSMGPLRAEDHELHGGARQITAERFDWMKPKMSCWMSVLQRSNAGLVDKSTTRTPYPRARHRAATRPAPPNRSKQTRPRARDAAAPASWRRRLKTRAELATASAACVSAKSGSTAFPPQCRTPAWLAG